MSIERISEIWPEWEVTEKLGSGSFGTVYKAVHKERMISMYSAIKVISIPQNETEIKSLLSEGMTVDDAKTYYESIVNDFTGEISLMGTMKGHPNIVSIEDFRVLGKKDSIRWDIFIRMELLDPFINSITKNEITEVNVIKLGVDICSALEFCSKNKVIHRDIKPENIFVNDFGNYKIGDFGIARELEKTSGTMSTKGTPNYMAPEVYHGQKYDATVDIYSLGLVLYRLLNNNRLPFLDPNISQITFSDRKNAIDRRLKGEILPPPVNANENLAAAILTACDPDPKKRFMSPSAFKNALLGATVSEKPVQNAVVEEEQTIAVAKDEPLPDMESTVRFDPSEKSKDDDAHLHNVKEKPAQEIRYGVPTHKDLEKLSKTEYGVCPYCDSALDSSGRCPNSYGEEDEKCRFSKSYFERNREEIKEILIGIGITLLFLIFCIFVLKVSAGT